MTTIESKPDRVRQSGNSQAPADWSGQGGYRANQFIDPQRDGSRVSLGNPDASAANLDLADREEQVNRQVIENETAGMHGRMPKRTVL